MVIGEAIDAARAKLAELTTLANIGNGRHDVSREVGGSDGE